MSILLLPRNHRFLTQYNRWSYGSDRIQVGAEIKLLQDFLSAVANDGIRAEHYTSSMADRTPAFLIPGASSIQEYLVQHKDRVRLLQLLVENEISRLAVWSNPVNEHGRTSAPAVGSLERSTSTVCGFLLFLYTVLIDPQADWTRLLQMAWKLNPAMAVQMGERFKIAPLQAEITHLVKSDPKAVQDVAEALHFLLGDKLEQDAKAALKASEILKRGKSANSLCSGCLYGQLYRQSQLSCISNPAMVIILLFYNTPCEYWNSIPLN